MKNKNYKKEIEKKNKRRWYYSNLALSLARLHWARVLADPNTFQNQNRRVSIQSLL